MFRSLHSLPPRVQLKPRRKGYDNEINIAHTSLAELLNTILGGTTMKTQKTIRKNIIATGFTILLGIGANQPVVAGDTFDQYYRNILLNPSKSLLLAEDRGRVTIYDGLDAELVDHAMDEQFERIENMMFVGIRHTLPDGSVEADDDCDS